MEVALREIRAGHDCESQPVDRSGGSGSGSADHRLSPEREEPIEVGRGRLQSGNIHLDGVVGVGKRGQVVGGDTHRELGIERHLEEDLDTGVHSAGHSGPQNHRVRQWIAAGHSVLEQIFGPRLTVELVLGEAVVPGTSVGTRAVRVVVRTARYRRAHRERSRLGQQVSSRNRHVVALSQRRA